MESYHFISLDDVSASQIEYVFKKMLAKEESKYCNFNRDNYEWHVGQRVFQKLKRLSCIYNFDLDFELRKFLGVDMIVNSLDCGTMDVHLVESGQIALSITKSVYNEDKANLTKQIQSANSDIKQNKEKRYCNNCRFFDYCTYKYACMSTGEYLY